MRVDVVMSRKGTKTITIPEEDHEKIKAIAESLEVGMQDVVLYSIEQTFSGKNSDEVDLDLLLEDIAMLTKRVAVLEDTNETLVRILKGKFPKDSNKLTKLLNGKDTYITELSSEYSIFGQEDAEMTTKQAINQCFSATPITVDPVSKIPPIFSEQKNSIPEFV